jgi:hypothetical protein
VWRRFRLVATWYCLDPLEQEMYQSQPLAAKQVGAAASKTGNTMASRWSMPVPFELLQSLLRRGNAHAVEGKRRARHRDRHGSNA